MWKPREQKHRLDHPRLHHLTSHERDVLAEFLSWLRERCGDRIAYVWLFGSKVRGDFDEESDVDLLIVAHDVDDALEEAVGEMAYDLSLKHGILLCEHVVSAWRFAQMRARQEFIYENVVGEGIDLWPLAIKSLKIGEERASYNTGSEKEDEGYGTHEDYLKERLNRAHEDIADAHRSLDVGSYRLALNRAYYAVFHIATATLALLGQERRRHSAVESAFHQYLIKPGFIEPEYGRLYREARQWRERADYRFDVVFDEKTAREIVNGAERLIARLEQFLHKRGLLTENSEARWAGHWET
nr:HEPN domain-containing protein [Anaerolineae bacterium]